MIVKHIIVLQHVLMLDEPFNLGHSRVSQIILNVMNHPFYSILLLLKSDLWIFFLSMVSAFFLEHVIPISHFLIGVMILVLVDLYTGIQAAKKRKEKLRSHGFRKSIVKIKDYFLAILLAQIFEKIWLEGFPLVHGISFAIALVEFRSNLENISEVTDVKFVNVILSILKLKK